jgi:hypothetical protein
MGNNERNQPFDADAQLERKIRQTRRFTPEEAIGRLAGPGAMKGASPVSRLQQAENEIGSWLSSHVSDPAGVLKAVLHRQLKGAEPLLNNVDEPLLVLARFCQQTLASDHLLEELVRQADVEWGRMMDELPYFQKRGSAPHPDDPYTVESVRNVLSVVLKQLAP